MTETEKRIESSKAEIELYKKLIELTKEIIEITLNKDKWGNKRPLSDFIEELTNHIDVYETSIKERLYVIWSNEGHY